MKVAKVVVKAAKVGGMAAWARTEGAQGGKAAKVGRRSRAPACKIRRSLDSHHGCWTFHTHHPLHINSQTPYRQSKAPTAQNWIDRSDIRRGGAERDRCRILPRCRSRDRLASNDM